MVSHGMRCLLLAVAIAYVAYGLPSAQHTVPEGARYGDSESDIQAASSGNGTANPTRVNTQHDHHEQHRYPGRPSKPAAKNDTRLATVPTTTQTSTTSNGTNATQTSTPSNTSRGLESGDAVLHVGKDDEVDKTPKTRHYFFSSWLTWKEDNYLMSILIPIACGMSAALLILCSLACIGCCRRKCRARSRRKLHRNIDPKSIRKLKTADRIKLLAASSDEEF